MIEGKMKIFLVGGAVRDKLLDLPSPDRDWVVVGSTPQQMLDQGFRAVGKDFPVFLHPETHEEYALARQERKSGRGYTGFQFNTDNTVSLEEDLLRRDLTINAIAMDENGELHDPYSGQSDIEQRLLRHVSPAFAEDPVRVLRVARFAARFHTLGFKVADETLELMKSMVTAGEVDHLVAERIWKETARALQESSPQVFIEVLRACGALSKLFPEIDNLFGIPQPAEHHPEIDTGVHSLMCLTRITELTLAPEARFAALVHDLGKAETPKELWPRHIAHEQRSLPLIEQMCGRLCAPNQYSELALIVAEFHTHAHRAFELTTKKLLATLKRIDALRRPQRFELFCLCCQADSQGRLGFENKPYPQANYLREARMAIADIDTKAMAASGLHGAAFGQALHLKQLEKLNSLKQRFMHTN